MVDTFKDIVLALLKTTSGSVFEFGIYQEKYLILWHRNQKDFQKVNIDIHRQLLAQSKLPVLIQHPEFIFPVGEELPAEISEYDITALNDAKSLINLGERNDILECYRNTTYPEKTHHIAFCVCYKKNKYCFPVLKKKYHYSQTNFGVCWDFINANQKNNLNNNELIKDYSENIYLIEGNYSKEKRIIKKEGFIQYKSFDKKDSSLSESNVKIVNETKINTEKAEALVDEITGTKGEGKNLLSTLADDFTKMEHNGFYFDEEERIVLPVIIFYRRVYDRYVTSDIKKIEATDYNVQTIQKLYDKFSGFDIKSGNPENYYILYKAPGTKDKLKYIAKKAGFYQGKLFDSKNFVKKESDNKNTEYYTNKIETPVYEIQEKNPELCEVMCDWLDSSPLIKCVAFMQQGDVVSGYFSVQYGYKNKVMNSFFCSTEKPLNFAGRLNEDVNAYLIPQKPVTCSFQYQMCL